MQGRPWISTFAACALVAVTCVLVGPQSAGAAGVGASIGDATVAETDPPLTGTVATTAFVTVRLSGPATGGEKLRVVTGNSVPTSATASTDYTALAKTLTLKAGVTQVAVPVKVKPDQLAEPTETLRVDLSVVSGAITVLRSQGTVTILDDDGVGASPALRVGDVTVVEGNGGFVLAKMEVDLDRAAPGPVTFRLATVAGTATPVSDYKALAANKTIVTGKRSTVASVKVYGDIANEPDEAFTVAVTNLAGASAAKAVGTATILDDDLGPTTVTATDPPNTHAQGDPTPRVGGASDAGVMIAVFTRAACSGTPAATGSSATFTGAGIPVPVPHNTTTSLSARATDSVGNTTCSSTPLAYTHDDIAPDRPSIDASSPPSPAADVRPRLSGTAETGSSVAVFDSGTCGGTPLTTIPASTFGSGFAVVMHPNAPTVLSARATDVAGNPSVCSVPFTYLHDDTPPLTPTISFSDPSNGQPRPDDHPELFGPSESGGIVRVYANASCAGSAVATGSASDFTTGPGITVAVAHDTTTTLTVDERDAAGNVSACSAPFAYTHDGLVPDPPVITTSSPDNSLPRNDSMPKIIGTAEAGATVELFTNGTCSGGPAASGSAAAFTGSGIIVSVGLNATTYISARQTDTGGNVSDCSPVTYSYTHDTIAPSVPTITGSTPTSPGASTTPYISGTSDAQTVVALWTNETCSGSPAVLTSDIPFASPGVSVTVATDATTMLSATATDNAGNTSACSARFAYTHVTAGGPSAPAIVMYIGDGFFGAYRGPSPSEVPPYMDPQFFIYSGPSCTGAPVLSGYAGSGPNWGVFGITTPYSGPFAHGAVVSANYRTNVLSPCSQPFVIP